jgi:hypothetical protein
VEERSRFRIAEGRPLLSGRTLQQPGEEVCDAVRREYEQEQPRPAPQDCEDEREREPDEPVRADPRQPLEDRVRPPRTVVDDPALEVPVEPGQTGSRLFV